MFWKWYVDFDLGVSSHVRIPCFWWAFLRICLPTSLIFGWNEPRAGEHRSFRVLWNSFWLGRWALFGEHIGPLSGILWCSGLFLERQGVQVGFCLESFLDWMAQRLRQLRRLHLRLLRCWWVDHLHPALRSCGSWASRIQILCHRWPFPCVLSIFWSSFLQPWHCLSLFTHFLHWLSQFGLEGPPSLPLSCPQSLLGLEEVGLVLRWPAWWWLCIGLGWYQRSTRDPFECRT